LLPIAAPLLLLPFGASAVLALLFMSLAFGGVQYVIFALLIFVVIGRLKSTKQIERLSYWAPLMFVPFQAIGWLTYSYIQRPSNPELTGIWPALFPLAVYALFIGYAYVGLVTLLNWLLARQGWVRDSTTT
jgi:hypothetical protein